MVDPRRISNLVQQPSKKMKLKFKTLPCLTSINVICALTACSTAPSVTVKTDYDHAATFGKYHTYAIDTASTGKESGRNADLYIVPTVFTRQQLNVMPGGMTVYRSRFGNYGGGWAMNADVQQYTEGSLVIDFVDGKTHKIVFRGLGRAAVGSTERNAAAIQEAVNKIVAAYPG